MKGRVKKIEHKPDQNAYVLPFIGLYFCQLTKAKTKLEALLAMEKENNKRLKKKTKKRNMTFNSVKFKDNDWRTSKMRRHVAVVAVQLIKRHEEKLSKAIDYFVNMNTGSNLLRKIEYNPNNLNGKTTWKSSRPIPLKFIPTFPKLKKCLELLRKNPHFTEICALMEKHNNNILILFASYENEHDYINRGL